MKTIKNHSFGRIKRKIMSKENLPVDKGMTNGDSASRS